LKIIPADIALGLCTKEQFHWDAKELLCPTVDEMQDMNNLIMSTLKIKNNKIKE